MGVDVLAVGCVDGGRCVREQVVRGGKYVYGRRGAG